MARLKIDLEAKYPTCERCGVKVPRVDYIDISKLTAKASYWRDMPNRIGICPECSKELSVLVDMWWLK